MHINSISGLPPVATPQQAQAHTAHKSATQTTPQAVDPDHDGDNDRKNGSEVNEGSKVNIKA